MQQAATRLRCDPTEYARKQQEKKDRAKELKENRTKGVFSEDHTFAPKVNARAAPPSREEDERPAPMQRSSQYDDIPIRPSKTLQASRKEILNPEEAPVRGAAAKKATNGNRPNNNDDHRSNFGDQDTDALDSLSRKFPKKTAAARQPEEAAYSPPTKMQPEHDSLYREVKRTTGRDLEDIPIAKLNGNSNARAGKHTGPCLRNSSCTCPQCSGMGGGSTSMSSSVRNDPPVRRRESRPAPVENDSYGPQTNTSRSNYGSQSEMENSLTLLKSKMSRRKARTAPSNQASLYDDDQPINEPASKSARQPPTYSSGYAASSSTSSPAVAGSRRSSQVAQQQPPPVANVRASQAPQPMARKPQQQPSRYDEDTRKPARYQEEENDDRPLPAPISSGFAEGEEPDEYDDGSTEMEECPDCHRKFNITSFSKHQKICAKVFNAQRKVFNMAAKRLEGTEAEKLLKEQGRKKGGKKPTANDEKPIKAKAADWKQQSNAFREAMRANRDIAKAVAEGRPPPPMAPSAPDPSLIPCDYCGRRFNDKAAERHIAFCKEKSQRDPGRGPPKKQAPVPAKAAPVKAAPPRKR